jgi:hypothetical protein
MPPGTGNHEAIITFVLFQFILEKQRMGLTLEPRSNGVEVVTQKQPRRQSGTSYDSTAGSVNLITRQINC